MEEGIGSEFILVHEIMRLHSGKFTSVRTSVGSGSKVTLTLELPELKDEERLRVVVASRIARVSPERGGLGTVVLALVEVNVGDIQEFEKIITKVKEALFRASDAVYPLITNKRLALLLDDCDPAAAPGILQRLAQKVGMKWRSGFASSPQDGVDPDSLIESAELRLKSG
jgi:hypothetical protein